MFIMDDDLVLVYRGPEVSFFIHVFRRRFVYSFCFCPPLPGLLSYDTRHLKTIWFCSCPDCLVFISRVLRKLSLVVPLAHRGMHI